MRRIGIMQPYIFPYIGYFQLIQAVDLFVLYDDVQYIKRGWINRNRILLDGKEHLFTIPCQNPSQNKLICETKVALDSKFKSKLIATFENAYRKAPYYSSVIPLVAKVLEDGNEFIDELAGNSIRMICSHLDIRSTLKSSKVYNNRELVREKRLIDICQRENSQHYVNAQGGKELYSKSEFASVGIDLSFIKSNSVNYDQMTPNFVPWLSIIDVLMFNSKDQVKELLNQYELN
ncbi:hypothetical protein WSM22_43740 [Cytophagales bacterium WSM2-2]|nr:hypothetical protein WSM22_43740 [Cytophagales bacterium WSM2-2]